MILGTKARYAVMAMVDLAARSTDRPVRLSQLAEAQEIPLPYLEQIFARLRRKGLVKSSRGPGGGYALSRAAADTCIADIVAAMDEPMRMTRCEGHGAKGCLGARGRCITHDLWEGLGIQIHNYLNGISLEDIVLRRHSVMKPSRADAIARVL